MKAIQITFEEDLLRDLDADERVKLIGRSALLRQLAREYLRRERERRIDGQVRPGLRRQRSDPGAVNYFPGMAQGRHGGGGGVRVPGAEGRGDGDSPSAGSPTPRPGRTVSGWVAACGWVPAGC